MKRRKKAEIDVFEQIKRLIMLQLIRDGASGEEIALALSITKARVSQIFPISKIRASKKSTRNESSLT